MPKRIFQSFLILVALISVFLSACEQEEGLNVTTDVSNYVESAIVDMEERAGCGKTGCYEFVFPLTLSFPDESVAEVASYEDMRETIASWKESNPDAEQRPKLVFPLEIISEGGEAISVSSIQELRELRRECRRAFRAKYHKGPKGPGRACFEVQFPLTLVFPDGTTAEATDRRNVQELLRSWKVENPEVNDRPEIQFPINVELEDGTIVSVESAEALKELKNTCSRGEDESESTDETEDNDSDA